VKVLFCTEFLGSEECELFTAEIEEARAARLLQAFDGCEDATSILGRLDALTKEKK